MEKNNSHIKQYLQSLLKTLCYTYITSFNLNIKFEDTKFQLDVENLYMKSTIQ